jgi:hypothetical protein
LNTLVNISLDVNNANLSSNYFSFLDQFFESLFVQKYNFMTVNEKVVDFEPASDGVSRIDVTFDLSGQLNIIEAAPPQIVLFLAEMSGVGLFIFVLGKAFMGLYAERQFLRSIMNRSF